MNIDKSKWTKVKFGEVAIQQKKCVDIETTHLNRYIAGEHMDTEDIHLRKWGIVGDGYLGPAFIRKFEKGDILYGSRRTYLKKVAVADFDGITANTTFVIKANEKIINPTLLPFLMLSDGFTKHSIENSKGSVNPYINWKDIANYEFCFHPKKNRQVWQNCFGLRMKWWRGRKRN
jgi:restriction endonuclease S subunit